jgi:erythromycin esterase
MTDDTTSTDENPTNEQTTADTGTFDADWPRADESLRPLADRLAERVVPLDGTDPTADLDDLAPLASTLSDARVVGLGEATHGTREFFRLKHRLIRFLVEQLDYRLVAMEANFAETLAVDEYVTHGRGDPRDALDGIRFWTWDTEEVLALLEWLRAFNEGRPLDNRVRFYGIDAQFTQGSAAALRDFFAERDPGFLDKHREALDTLIEDGIDVDWDSADGEGDANAGDSDGTSETTRRIERAAAAVDAMRAWFADRDHSDDAEFALHRQHLRALGQALGYRRRGHDGDMQAAIDVRDRAMAENLGWILDHSPHDRVALWAHDTHLQRVVRDTRFGLVPSTGSHLADRYGDDYYAVGFDFADGEFRALGPAEDGDGRELGAWSLGPPPADAATRLFATAEEPLWVLDLADATDDERLAAYLDEERPVRSLGAIYDPDDEHERLHDSYRLPEAFDALVFVAETGPARPIARE